MFPRANIARSRAIYAVSTFLWCNHIVRQWSVQYYERKCNYSSELNTYSEKKNQLHLKSEEMNMACQNLMEKCCCCVRLRCYLDEWLAQSVAPHVPMRNTTWSKERVLLAFMWKRRSAQRRKEAFISRGDFWGDWLADDFKAGCVISRQHVLCISIEEPQPEAVYSRLLTCPRKEKRHMRKKGDGNDDAVDRRLTSVLWSVEWQQMLRIELLNKSSQTLVIWTTSIWRVVQIY